MALAVTAEATEAKVKQLINEDKYAEAERLLATKLDTFRGKQDNAGIASILLLMSEVALGKLEAAKALADVREAFPIAKASGDKKLQAKIMVAMVNALNLQSSGQEAVQAAVSGMPVVKAASDPLLEADMLHAQAVAYIKMDDPEQAEQAEKKALAIRTKEKDTKGIVVSTTTIAKALRMIGRFDEAISGAKDAAAQWRTMGNAAGVVACVEIISDAQAMQGSPKAAFEAAEEELELLRKAGADKKNELMMMEKVASVASDQGLFLDALRIMDDMVSLCKKAGDKLGVAQRTKQAAVMHAEMNHTQDALRLAKEAQELFGELGMAKDMEECRKVQTAIFVRKGQQTKAPHRSEALLALKSFVRAIENREKDEMTNLEVQLDRCASCLKDDEMTTALESLFERDPKSLSFLEDHGWNLSNYKKPTYIFQYPHKAQYLASSLGGMGFGPQFRGVHPYRKGRTHDLRALSVCQLAATESWQGGLLYRHGIMDAGIQSQSIFYMPPFK